MGAIELGCRPVIAVRGWRAALRHVDDARLCRGRSRGARAGRNDRWMHPYPSVYACDLAASCTGLGIDFGICLPSFLE